MPTPLLFAYYSGSTLRTTQRDLLFRVAISEYSVLMPMAFLLALTSVLSGLLKTFPGVVNLVSVGVSFPILLPVCKFVDAIQFFQIICRCSFEASLAFLSFWCLTEIDWEDTRCVGWL